MKSIVIRPKASSDLDEQALFIARDNIDAALRFYDACAQAFTALANMPNIGYKYLSQRKELSGMRIYAVPGFAKHLIFYIPHSDRVEVVRVLYATRDIPNIL